MLEPKNIFMLGNSCTGKSSFASKICQQTAMVELDDTWALHEIFQGDELICQHYDDSDFIEKWQFFIASLCFTKELWPKNISELKKPLFSISKASGGFVITDPTIWDVILKLTAATMVKDQQYIFVFARGNDVDYGRLTGTSSHKVYNHALELIFTTIGYVDECMALYFQSPISNRISRNEERYRLGYHKISKRGMFKIYYDENISFSNENGIDYIVTTFGNIPTLTVDVPELSEIERASFYEVTYQKALSFYQAATGINDA